MKLESLALWEEKELFGECSDEDKGYRGYCKYIFTPKRRSTFPYKKPCGYGGFL